MLALTLPLVLVAVATGCFLYFSRRARRGRFAVAGAMALAALPGALRTPREERNAPPVRLNQASEYVSSATCRSCHPSEYASWQRSYHRTMTQAASPTTVLLPIAAPTSLTLDGRRYELRRRGDTLWATLPDPDTLERAEGLRDGSLLAEIERPVLLTTGSHHYQALWLGGRSAKPDLTGEASPGGEEPLMFPFVYLLDGSGWRPRREVFVEPPDAPNQPVHWRSNCIQCHTTAGRPGYDSRTDRLDSDVAELGIACEACHGPGGEHVKNYEDPIERYATSYGPDRADPTIVNPSRLSGERASMICGACHAYTFPRDEEDFWVNGYTRSFRPGQDLGASRLLLTAESLQMPGAPSIDTGPENLFFDDGTVRIGGREYSAMVQSACYERGEGKRKLSCLSCHSMHDSDPDDQLARGREGDGACATCHEPARYGTTSHTHHAAGSLGGSCLGCHMPMTEYALLKSIRSHRIDSPKAKDLARSDRPNACNLCHLDRSLAWSQSYLGAWYGQRASQNAPDGDADAAGAAGASWLLAGDPGERVLAAAAMGNPGPTASDWRASLLSAAREDPYAAVRFVAERSLRHLPTESREHVRAPMDGASLATLVARRSPRALTLSE